MAPWDYDVEAVKQFDSFNDLDIDAWFFSGVYALSGMVLRGAHEGQSSYVGWRTGVFARYAINPFVSVMGVANYTKAGDFLKETGTAYD